MSDTPDRPMLARAAMAGLRAAGAVEPNPLVGCVIVEPASGRILGMGHHRRFGGPHAEIEAMEDARRRGRDVRGARVYVTLEPCNHHGKTGPCTEALIAAGVGEVVFARRDPNPAASGGAVRLERAGIAARLSDACPAACRLSDPFVKRLRSPLPWVIAKWALTRDGRMVTRPDEPRWITGFAARRSVHALRGRVDAVITGIGTVLADDPLLTVRGVPARRRPLRVVLDPRLRTPLTSAIVASAAVPRRGEAAGVLIVCGPRREDSPAADRLRGVGVRVIAVPEADGLSLDGLLAMLRSTFGVSTALVEAGPTLTRAFLTAGLVDEAWGYAAGGDEAGPFASLLDAHRHWSGRRWPGGDRLARWWRPVLDPVS
ncbi:MAG: bifunctional diaminohydroxyphosphoribosylaminopyrimidine deaminase/5-amino-6-(5-phosphoribosylamino)uracil reductase RibD [Phycisphaerales bacterium]|nr:bifunctional diaminohydroxyphosphoribosylaminopyrimidine deaminase/5-amino-6-(5-phosphoribosylamino)uracil reductase RibD [Phycisphaerales bacterium]